MTISEKITELSNEKEQIRKTGVFDSDRLREIDNQWKDILSKAFYPEWVWSAADSGTCEYIQIDGSNFQFFVQKRVRYKHPDHCKEWINVGMRASFKMDELKKQISEHMSDWWIKSSVKDEEYRNKMSTLAKSLDNLYGFGLDANFDLIKPLLK